MFIKCEKYRLCTKNGRRKEETPTEEEVAREKEERGQIQK